MRIRTVAMGLVCVASLTGQSRGQKFRWQDYCFNHPAAPFCQGHDYAVKRPKATKDTAGTAPGEFDTDPLPATPPTVTPSVIVVGGIDWRFADPSADALVGFNYSALSSSPLARSVIAGFRANQGLTEADMQKIFERLSGVGQVALSVRGSQIVAMIGGRAADSTLPTLEAGLKAVPVSGNAMLVGHSDAVDQAVQRIAAKGPPAELTHLAEERQAGSDFWAVGSAGFAGPQAVSAGAKRFSLAISIREHLASDLFLEFDGIPGANTLGLWQPTFGVATLEGNVVHVKTSMEADEVRRKFGQIAASPHGRRLADLITAARYLPAPGSSVPKPTKPIIYGLESGPKEVTQLPR
jgi:hypothetical protein